MLTELETVLVTPENIDALSEKLDYPIRVGMHVQLRKPDTLDSRPFGQLRTMLGDPP